MILVIAIIASLVPSLLLYVYLRNLRKEDDEYGKNCRHILVRGILCCIGVFFLDLIVVIAWNALGLDVSPLVQKIFRTFVMYAFVEELVKFLHVRHVITKDCGQISWLDCIAYFGIVGIGFQIIETFAQAFSSGIGQILVKGITMGHPSYGMMMGYFIGRSYHTGNRPDAWIGFLLPFFLHGLYDLSLSEEFLAINDNLVFVPFILIAIEVVVLIKLILFVRKHKNDPEYTKPM